MHIFKNDDQGYVDWNVANSVGYVLNNFGGNTAAFNVLHKSTCVFLWRDKDEGSRTVVEKWCSADEHFIEEYANQSLGFSQWRRCAVCFRGHDAAKHGLQTEDERKSTNVSASIESENISSSSVWVSGEPSVWLGSGERQWKEKVKSALQATSLPSEPQWIDANLYLTDNRLFAKDIDNLLTPILESARDSGWIQRGFAFLGSVTAQKILCDSAEKQGVAITPIAVPPNVSQGMENGVCVEVEVERFDEKTVKWALYDRAFEMFSKNPELRFAPQTELSLKILVVINNAQRRKSIQALLKPCIDGLEPILGHPDNLLPVGRTELNRSLAPQDEMVMNLEFHVRGGEQNHISVVIQRANQK